MRFEDGAIAMSFVCQVIRVEEEDIVVNSYVSVRNGKNASHKKVFKKYPEEEAVRKEQILAQIEKPEMMPGRKFLFKHDLNYDVK